MPKPKKIKINRKRLNRLYRDMSREGKYFSGATLRDVACQISAKLKLHPSYVGNIDDLLMKQVAAGRYGLSNGVLVRTDNTSSDVLASRAKKEQILLRRQSKRRTKARERDFHTSWVTESLLPMPKQPELAPA